MDKDFIIMQGVMFKYKRENKLNDLHSNITRGKSYLTMKEYPDKSFIYIMFFSPIMFNLEDLSKGFFENIGDFIHEVIYVKKLNEFVPIVIIKDNLDGVIE